MSQPNSTSPRDLLESRIIAAALELYRAERAISERREPWRRTKREHNGESFCLSLHEENPCEICQAYLAGDGHGHKYRLAQRISARRKLLTACARLQTPEETK